MKTKKPRKPLRRRTAIKPGSSEFKRSRFEKKASHKGFRKSPETHSRAWLDRELWRLTSLIVRRQETFCVLCGSREELQAGHVFGRAHRATRYDIDPRGNVHTQCGPCNRRHNRKPEIYRAWFKASFGWEAWEEMERRAKTAIHWREDQLWEMIQTRRESLAGSRP